MAIKLSDKPNVEAPSAAYPFGSIRDTAGGVLGTPVSREVYGDIHQFFEKLMSYTNTVHNDMPDNDTNGFQLFEAFRRYGRFIEGHTLLISQYGFDDPTCIENNGDNVIHPSTLTRVGIGEYTVKPGLIGITQSMIVHFQNRNSSSGHPVIKTEIRGNELFIETWDGAFKRDGVLDGYLVVLEWVNPI